MATETDDDRERRMELLTQHGGAAGPGKYEGEAFPACTSYVHTLTLEGWTAEECGTVEYGPGWHGLVYFGERVTADLVLLGWEPDVDAAPESRPVAVIVREDDRGFVSATFYDSEDAAQADWTEIQGACDDAEDDQDDEI